MIREAHKSDQKEPLLLSTSLRLFIMSCFHVFNSVFQLQTCVHLELENTHIPK